MPTMTDIDPDEALAQFDRKRDEQAFRTLYRAHTGRLFALGFRLTGRQSEAEELVQECWVRAIERHDRFQRASRYSTWLAGILVNCFRESVRRNGLTVPADEAAGDPPASGTPCAGIDLANALLLLPVGFREIVLLHDGYGHTHDGVGSARALTNQLSGLTQTNLSLSSASFAR